MKAVIFLTLFIFVIGFVSASGENLMEPSGFAFDNQDGPILIPTINYSELPSVNASELWLTNEGVLDNVADILHGWLNANSLLWSNAGHTIDTDVDFGSNAIDFTEWTMKEFPGHANLNGVPVLGLFVERFGSGEDIEHMAFNPGGDMQATAIRRSLAIVDDSVCTGTNATNMPCYADAGGFEWSIDFSTDITGADLGVTDDFEVIGDAWFADEQGEKHNMNRMLTHNDALQDDNILDSVSIYTENNGTHTMVFLNSTTGDDIEVNFDQTIYSLGAPIVNVTLTSGTTTSPQVNFVWVGNGGTPSMQVASAHPGPGVEAIDVATYYIGENGAIQGFTPVTQQLYEGIHGMQKRAKVSGPLYVIGYDPSVDADEFNLSSGNSLIIYDLVTCPSGTMQTDGFFYIDSIGEWIYGTDLSIIDEYSDGTSIGANKYLPLVAGTIPTSHNTCQLVFVSPGYPGAGNEYISCKAAEEDAKQVRNVFPPDVTVKEQFTPTTWMLMKSQDDTFCAFQNGEYSRKIAGSVTSGGGAPTSPSTDHAALSNLDFASALHTGFFATDGSTPMQGNTSQNGFDIKNVSNINPDGETLNIGGDVNIDTGNIANAVVNTEWDLAYDHSIDNSQAHSDYMRNSGDTSTGNYNFGSGSLTTTGLITGGQLQIDSININNAVISSSTGIISFSNDNLITTGNTETEGLIANGKIEGFDLFSIRFTSPDGWFGANGNYVTDWESITDSPVSVGAVQANVRINPDSSATNGDIPIVRTIHALQSYKWSNGGDVVDGTVYSADFNGDSSYTGTITNFRFFQVIEPSDIPNGEITNLFGLDMVDMTIGVNDWAIRTGLGLVEFGDDVVVRGKLNVSESIEYNGTLLTHSPFVTCGVEEEKCWFADFSTETTGWCMKDGRGVWSCDGANIKVLEKLNIEVAREEARIILAREMENCEDANYSYDRNGCYEIVEYSKSRGEAIRSALVNITEEINATCEGLSRSLEVVSYDCLETITTSEQELVWAFKDDCDWNREDGFYCEVREVRLN